MFHCFRVACLGILVVSLTACMAEKDKDQTGSVPIDAGVEAPAGKATYRCEDGTSLSIDNRLTEVALVDPEGEVITLPAAPATQRSRFGQEGRALVLDGADALYMKGGKEPLSCNR